MFKEITIAAPAKINLTLDVKGKRPDGYHELETVMHQIDLIDRVHLQPRDRGIKITSDNPDLPDGKENLAYRAAALVLAQMPEAKGAAIFIEKKIPVGAGLAGGSTDAAAVIKGLNRLYNLQLGQDTMLRLGAAVGSDVPFCIAGGTALARGRGEILSALPSPVRLQMVLVKPDFQLSTAQVYNRLRLSEVKQRPDLGAFLEAWTKCDIINIANCMVNVLETVSIKEYRQISIIKNEMISLGALGAVMSGSGSSVVGIFPDRSLAVGAGETLKSRYQEVYLVSSYQRGDECGE